MSRKFVHKSSRCGGQRQCTISPSAAFLVAFMYAERCRSFGLTTYFTLAAWLCKAGLGRMTDYSQDSHAPSPTS